MKKKVLIPLDGSNRDLISINYLKENFNPEDTEVLLLNVGDIVYAHGIVVSHLITIEKDNAQVMLDRAKKLLNKFDCTAEFQFGYIDKTIINYSVVDKVDIIIMTKHNKGIRIPFMGSIVNKVVKKAKCTVIVLSEI